MSELKCEFGKCRKKATAKCSCKKPFVLFCDEHLGNHLLNSSGNHNFKKLLDDPYLQTKSSIKNLKDLKESIVKEIHFKIIELENILENKIENIDKGVFVIENIINEVMQTSEISNKNAYLEYLKLPSSEAVVYFKESVINLNLQQIQISSLNEDIMLKDTEASFYKNQVKILEEELNNLKTSLNLMKFENKDLEKEIAGLKQILYQASADIREFQKQNDLI